MNTSMILKVGMALGTVLCLVQGTPAPAWAQSASPATLQPTAPPREDLPGSPQRPLAVQIVEAPLPVWKNRIVANPLGLILGVGNIAYERGLGKRFSIEIAPSFMYWGWTSDKIYGGLLGVGGAFYFIGDAPRGLFTKVSASPGFFRGTSAPSSTSPETSVTGYLFAAKALVGYNWIWKSGFTLGLARGVQYMRVRWDTLSSPVNGVLPAGELNLGFAF